MELIETFKPMFVIFGCLLLLGYLSYIFSLFALPCTKCKSRLTLTWESIDDDKKNPRIKHIKTNRYCFKCAEFTSQEYFNCAHKDFKEDIPYKLACKHKDRKSRLMKANSWNFKTHPHRIISVWVFLFHTFLLFQKINFLPQLSSFWETYQDYYLKNKLLKMVLIM